MGAKHGCRSRSSNGKKTTTFAGIGRTSGRRDGPLRRGGPFRHNRTGCLGAGQGTQPRSPGAGRQGDRHDRRNPSRLPGMWGVVWFEDQTPDGQRHRWSGGIDRIGGRLSAMPTVFFSLNGRRWDWTVATSRRNSLVRSCFLLPKSARSSGRAWPFAKYSSRISRQTRSGESQKTWAWS